MIMLPLARKSKPRILLLLTEHKIEAKAMPGLIFHLLEFGSVKMPTPAAKMLTHRL